MTAIPALLLPYQAEAIELSHRHQLFVVEKSRRTGFTYAWGADAVLTAAAARGGMDVFYIAYNLDMTREFIGYCADFAKSFDQATGSATEFLFDDGSEEGIKAFRIDLPSGHAIVALSSKPRSLRGKQGLVIIDEAAFHDALAELLKAAIALLMWGGRVVVISTHDGADNPFNDLVEEIRAKKRAGYVYRTTLKDALAAGLYKRICLRTGRAWSREAEAAWEADLRRTYGDAADEELDVIPARGSGTYLARATIEATMTTDYPLVRLTCPSGFERQDREFREDYVAEWLEEQVFPAIATFDPARASFFGQDFARSSDLSAIALGQIDAHTVLHCRLMIEMRNVPFREQKQVLDAICRRMPRFASAKMDARGNGQQIAEDMQEDWGVDRIAAIMATPKTYLAMMPRLKARIEDQTLRLPRRDEIVDDLRLIKLVRGVPSIPDRAADKADGAKGKRHGDTAIALMHLVAAADEDVLEIDFFGLGSNRVTAGDFSVTDSGFGTIRRDDTADAFTLGDY